jgi:hypothetical protein
MTPNCDIRNKVILLNEIWPVVCILSECAHSGNIQGSLYDTNRYMTPNCDIRNRVILLNEIWPVVCILSEYAHSGNVQGTLREVCIIPTGLESPYVNNGNHGA